VKISTAVSFTISIAIGGCGSRAGAPAPAPPAAAGALARAGLLAGDWRVAGDDAAVTWLRPGGEISAIYGVAATAVPVAWVIDDAPDEAAPADRHVVLWRYQGDAAPRVCAEKVDEPDGLTFACEEGAGGTKFWRNGEVLDVEDWTASSGPDRVHLNPAQGAPAPDLEAADRQFDQDTAAKGADGWVAWFADDGVQWQGTKAIRGHDAIRAGMTATLQRADLRWQPTVSRMLVPDTLGVTAGTWTVTPRQGPNPPRHGTYMTVWHKAPLGWRILMDVGRPDR